MERTLAASMPAFKPGDSRRRDVARSEHDFDLHGLARIRLLDAGAPELAAVRAQLGPIDADTAGRDPDIVIRFVERLPQSGPLRLLGAREAGFTEDAFLVLRGKHKVPVAVEIPFEKIGESLEIRCERGLPAVPLLVPILNLTVLARGGLPLHASAFRYGGRGVLAPGWAKGGKTELLLAFAAQGAEYVGDEWVYLDRDGDRMSGIPEPIRIWDWHLEELPAFRRRASLGQRGRLALLRGLARCAGRAAGAGEGPLSPWRRGARRLSHLVENQRYMHLPPTALFGQHDGPRRSPLDLVLFVSSHDSSETVLEPIAAAEVADRMTASLQEERSDLMSLYRHFRFAFPRVRNTFLDSVEEVERGRLHDFMRGRRCYVLHHPYPPSLPALFDAARSLFFRERVDVVQPAIVESVMADSSRASGTGRADGGRT